MAARHKDASREALARLPKLDIHELREEWRRLYKADVSPHLSRELVIADLSLPDGVSGESIGGLKWRCFGRRGHPAFSDWGLAAWSRWPHLVVRVGGGPATRT
jgi:hypothetical protein